MPPLPAGRYRCAGRRVANGTELRIARGEGNNLDRDVERMEMVLLGGVRELECSGIASRCCRLQNKNLGGDLLDEIEMERALSQEVGQSINTYQT